MTAIFNKPLVLVTGKGGVGKSTVAAALGVATADSGLKTLVCEVGAQSRIARLLDASPVPLGQEQEVRPGLWTVSIDPDDALKAWLGKQLGSRSLVNILTRSNLFSYFVAAAPGARELVTATKIWELAQRRPPGHRPRAWAAEGTEDVHGHRAHRADRVAGGRRGPVDRRPGADGDHRGDDPRRAAGE